MPCASLVETHEPLAAPTLLPCQARTTKTTSASERRPCHHLDVGNAAQVPHAGNLHDTSDNRRRKTILDVENVIQVPPALNQSDESDNQGRKRTLVVEIGMEVSRRPNLRDESDNRAGTPVRHPLARRPTTHTRWRAGYSPKAAPGPSSGVAISLMMASLPCSRYVRPPPQ